MKKQLTEERFIEIINKREKQRENKFRKEFIIIWLLLMLFFLMAQIGAFFLGAYLL